jgi:hypothetical protein
MIGTCVLSFVEVHRLVPEYKKATTDPHEITVDEVKRVLEVGRLLLSVLTQAEIEMLRRHFQDVLSRLDVGYVSPNTPDVRD